MRGKIKSLFTKLFVIFMAAVLLLEADTPVMAANISAGDTGVSENSLSQNVLSAEEDEVVPLETYNGIPTEWLEDDESDTDTYSAESGYLTEDAFYKTTTKRGLQGDFNGASYNGSYGTQHTLINVNVTDLMGDGSVSADQRFDYNGYTYYFRDYKSALIKSANAKGATVSIVILVPKVAGKEILIDSTALASNNSLNSLYYAPNVRGDGRRYYEALFAWMAETWCKEDCHVDNFILGNEVNMPNAWHFSGSSDPQYNVELYADAYLILYNAIRSKTSASRVSISLDHSWQHDDEGRGITTKDYLNRFNATISSRQANVDWSISYHIYPAILSQPDIWEELAHMPDAPALDLNPKDSSAKFVDGNNLNILTDYVRDTFGAEHRIMLTEQGFTQYMGTAIQAASLAYTYYAAKYNSMVDCFILNTMNEGGKLNFSISGTLAEQVFAKLDSDPSWVEAQTLSTIGVSSYTQIVPNYGKTINRTQIQAYVTRLYQLCLGRNPDTSGFAYWTERLCSGQISGAAAAYGFFFSEEFKGKNISNDTYTELLYNVMMGRGSDAAGKADWTNKLENGVSREGVFKGFSDSVEFSNICSSYGITRGTIELSQARDKNAGLTAFVSRLYTKALGRQYDVDGLNDWCGRILNGSWSINDVSTIGFFNSQEFCGKNLSNSEYVKVLYRTFLDREYDQQGYDYWMAKLSAGVSRNEVLLGFANSREFTEMKASYGL